MQHTYKKMCEKKENDSEGNEQYKFLHLLQNCYRSVNLIWFIPYISLGEVPLRI